MGVYINMEMPTSCAFCKIKRRNGKKMVCPLCGEEWDVHDPMSADHRLDNCPLVPASTPHGRLIDADELKAKQQEDADLFINAYTQVEKSRRDEALNAVANIVNAPTIIEAEPAEVGET